MVKPSLLTNSVKAEAAGVSECCVVLIDGEEGLEMRQLLQAVQESNFINFLTMNPLM